MDPALIDYQQARKRHHFCTSKSCIVQANATVFYLFTAQIPLLHLHTQSLPWTKHPLPHRQCQRFVIPHVSSPGSSRTTTTAPCSRAAISQPEHTRSQSLYAVCVLSLIIPRYRGTRILTSPGYVALMMVRLAVPDYLHGDICPVNILLVKESEYTVAAEAGNDDDAKGKDQNKDQSKAKAKGALVDLDVARCTSRAYLQLQRAIDMQKELLADTLATQDAFADQDVPANLDTPLTDEDSDEIDAIIHLAWCS
ncbi:hypothetical protein PLICRDRAFT_648609 [Plicaturopsis crispa FD-325 SS-3]|nr:hypothetical protein PLICRDRAFT_648609 [Plicaturopsis crispa FD-325 SS-3]